MTLLGKTLNKFRRREGEEYAIYDCVHSDCRSVSNAFVQLRPRDNKQSTTQETGIDLCLRRG